MALEDILETVMGLLGPSEAEAASLPLEEYINRALVRQRMQQESAQQQQQFQREQAQSREAALGPKRAVDLQLAERKLAPPPDLRTLLRQGQGQASDLPQGSSIFGYGSFPETGLTPEERFNTIIDYLTQGEAPPEAVVGAARAKDFTPTGPTTPGQPFGFKGYEGEVGFNPQTRAFTNIGIGAPSQTKAPGAPDDTELKRAELAEKLKDRLPKEELENLLDAQFGKSPSKVREAESKKAEKESQMLLQTDLSKWYNKETGEPAGVDEIETMADLRKRYMKLNTNQLNDVSNLPLADNLVKNYERLAIELPFGKAGKGSRAASILTIKDMRLAGHPAVQDLDSINARISSLATAFGGDKRVSDAEMRLLLGAVLQDTDTKEGVARKLKNLREFTNLRLKSSGLPWLKPSESGEGKGTASGEKPGVIPMSEWNEAMRQAKGNKAAARQLLIDKGYTGREEVK